MRSSLCKLCAWPGDCCSLDHQNFTSSLQEITRSPSSRWLMLLTSQHFFLLAPPLREHTCSDHKHTNSSQDKWKSWGAMPLKRAWFLRRFSWAIINASICFRSSLWQAWRDSAGSGVRASDASLAFGCWDVRQTNREDLNRSYLNKCPLAAGSSGVCTCFNFCMSQTRSETWWRGEGVSESDLIVSTCQNPHRW